ncbi:hypothetical protein [Absidia glauca]|uniref:Ndc10 domain-containing protein n=1 Tax=Absidia glauca TaxID=4829 RepID=A0A168S867_ABSGL|nr:hypothetical protein [Absidia glauca]
MRFLFIERYQKQSGPKAVYVHEHCRKPSKSELTGVPKRQQLVQENVKFDLSIPFTRKPMFKKSGTFSWGILQTEPPGQNQSVWDSIRNEDKPLSQAQERSYSSHRELIGKILSSPGIRANKKAYINCGSSARMEGNVCANEDQIRRQGRWNNTTITSAYFTNLSRELVRSMAGFSTYGRFFYLARATLNPPTSLCKKLFPTIGE